MSSDISVIEEPSGIAVHEAAHAVIHAVGGGNFRYVTLRPRLAGRSGHVYGVVNAGPAAILAGPLAKAIWEGAEGFLTHMIEQGGCDDIELFFEVVALGEEGEWIERSGELVIKHWDEILMVARMLERRRTLTALQVRAILTELSKETA